MGESAPTGVAHIFSCFLIMGLPHSIKTDSGTAYTSKAFATFHSIYAIHHVTSLLYNPQG